MKTYNENKNLVSLSMYFVPQTLKPGYGPGQTYLNQG